MDKTVAIIGAGQMGSGIAQTVAAHGMDVLLADVSLDVAEKAHAGIDKAFGKLVGKGKIEMVDSGDVHELTPGTIYLLDKHDEHYLYGGENEDMVVACAFTPPLSGKEVRDENGVYPADLD